MEFPGYRIVEKVYEGKLAEVFLYEHNRNPSDRFVAKILLPRHQADDAKVDRFRCQAEVMMRLEHPGIARVEEVETSQGRTYARMPYYRHGALWKPLASGRGTEKKKYPWRVVREIARQVGGVLDYCADGERNAYGPVLHCDIKPQNIVIGSVSEQGVPDRVLLIDFSLDRLPTTDEGSFSKTETLRAGEATVMYQSPEQAAGAEELDVRSDLFSLGMTLWALLLGDDPPVGRKNRHGKFSESSLRVERKDPEFDFSVLFDPSWPDDCRFILYRLLRKDRDDRLGGPAELLELLDRPADEAPVLEVGESVECEPLDVFDKKVNELYAKRIEHCYSLSDGRVMSAFLPCGDGSPWSPSLIYYLERQFLPWLAANPSPLLPVSRGRWHSAGGVAYLFDHLSGPSLADCYGKLKSPRLQQFLPHLHRLARLAESLGNDAGDVLLIDVHHVRVQFLPEPEGRDYGLSAWERFCSFENHADLPPHRWLVWPHFELFGNKDEVDHDVTRTMDADGHGEDLTIHQQYFALLYHLISGGMPLSADAYVDAGFYQKTGSMTDASNKLVSECIAGQKSDSLTVLLGSLAANEGCPSLDSLGYPDAADFTPYEVLAAPPADDAPEQDQDERDPVPGGDAPEMSPENRGAYEEIEQLRDRLRETGAERDALTREIEAMRRQVDQSGEAEHEIARQIDRQREVVREKEREIERLDEELRAAVAVRRGRDEVLGRIAAKVGLSAEALSASSDLGDFDEALAEIARSAGQDADRFRQSVAKQLGLAAATESNVENRLRGLLEVEREKSGRESLLDQVAAFMGFAGGDYDSSSFLGGLEQARKKLEEGASRQGREEERRHLGELLEKVEGRGIDDKIHTLLKDREETARQLEAQREGWRGLAVALGLDPSKEWSVLVREIPAAWRALQEQRARGEKALKERESRLAASLKVLGLNENDLGNTAKAREIRTRLDGAANNEAILTQVREAVPGKPATKDLPGAVQKHLKRAQTPTSGGAKGDKAGAARRPRPVLAAAAMFLALACLAGGYYFGEMRADRGEERRTSAAPSEPLVPAAPGVYTLDGNADFKKLLEKENSYRQKLRFSHRGDALSISDNSLTIPDGGESFLLHLQLLCAGEPVDSVVIDGPAEGGSINLDDYLASTSLGDLTLTCSFGDLKLAERTEEDGTGTFIEKSGPPTTDVADKKGFFDHYVDFGKGLSLLVGGHVRYPLEPESSRENSYFDESAIYVRRGELKPEWHFTSYSDGEGEGLAAKGYFEGQVFRSDEQTVELDLARSQLKLRVDWGIGEEEYEDYYKKYSPDVAMPVGYDLTLRLDLADEDQRAVEIFGLRQFSSSDSPREDEAVLFVEFPDFDRISVANSADDSDTSWSRRWIKLLPANYQQLRDYTLADKKEKESQGDKLRVTKSFEVGEVKPALGQYGIFEGESSDIWDRFVVFDDEGDYRATFGRLKVEGKFCPRYDPESSNSQTRQSVGSGVKKIEYLYFDLYVADKKVLQLDGSFAQAEVDIKEVSNSEIKLKSLPEVPVGGQEARWPYFGCSPFIVYTDYSRRELLDEVEKLLYAFDKQEIHGARSERLFIDGEAQRAEVTPDLLADRPGLMAVGGRRDEFSKKVVVDILLNEDRYQAAKFQQAIFEELLDEEGYTIKQN